MKSLSAQLQSFLATATSAYRVDLLTLTLPNGQVITAAMGVGDDVVWNGVTYYASAFGVWERGAQASVAEFSLESQGLRLTVTAADSVLVPGTATPLMAVISAGFFDASTVAIETAYMDLASFGTIIGTMTLFAGTIVTAARVGRSQAEFQCQDSCYLLNLKVPIKVIQPSCPHTLFDHGCALQSGNFAFQNSVASGSTAVVIVPVSNWPTGDGHGNNPQQPPYFAQGKIQFLSGQNANLWGHVAAQQANTPNAALTLSQAMPFPVAMGDVFLAYSGCDKSLGTCTSKFQNQLHFGGMPFVPPPERSI